MMSSEAELEKFLDRRARSFADAMLGIVESLFASEDDKRRAIEHLAGIMQGTMILADLHGRRRALMEADRARRAAFGSENPITPGIPFEEAIIDLMRREPRLANSAEAVSRLYSHQNTIAMARSASMRLTERVQRAMVQQHREGQGLGESLAEILKIAKEESHDWTLSYAQTVYRTNTSSAYTGGRFAQAKDPEVREAVPALELVGIRDGRTRPNHRAAQGFIAAADHPEWSRIRPPLGYQCRDGTRFVPRSELEHRGLMNEDGTVTPYYPPDFQYAHPDPGFRAGEF